MAAPNNRRTSPSTATKASKVLADHNSTKAAAGSALSQAGGSKGQTSKQAAAQASTVLANSKSTKAEKAAAASTLAQTPKRANKK